jgi:hypothetical protein
MRKFTCPGCGKPVPAAHAHIRSVRFVQVGWCRPCGVPSEDAARVNVPAPRRSLAVELAAVVARGVAEAEAYANQGGVRR